MHNNNRFTFYRGIFIQTLLILIPILIFNKGLPNLLPFFELLGTSIFLILLVITLTAYISKRKVFIVVTQWINLISFLSVFAMFLTFYISSFLVITDAIGFENFLRQHLSVAKYIYFLICFAQPIILPLPEMVTVVAASSVLGPFTAFVFGFLGTILGICTMFFVSRIGGIKLVAKLINEKHLLQYHKYVQKNETLIISILFIIPVLPDEIICVGAGVSGVNIKKFLSIAVISKLITSFLLAYSVELASVFSLTTSQLMLYVSIIALILFGVGMLIKKMLNN